MCCSEITLKEIADVISIITPIVLVCWFYYSQRHTLSKNYFENIPGIYGGFTDPKNKGGEGYRVYSGIIMNIKDIDSNGFFKGELDFAETTTEVHFMENLILNSNSLKYDIRLNPNKIGSMLANYI